MRLRKHYFQRHSEASKIGSTKTARFPRSRESGRNQVVEIRSESGLGGSLRSGCSGSVAPRTVSHVWGHQKCTGVVQILCGGAPAQFSLNFLGRFQACVCANLAQFPAKVELFHETKPHGQRMSQSSLSFLSLSLLKLLMSLEEKGKTNKKNKEVLATKKL